MSYKYFSYYFFQSCALNWSNDSDQPRPCHVQYCAKKMQTKFGVFRCLFSRKFDEISPRNFVKTLENLRQVKRNFASTEAKFRRSENWQLRNFAIAKIRAREISPGRKFAAAKFPQSETLVAVEEGCNKNLLFGPL